MKRCISCNELFNGDLFRCPKCGFTSKFDDDCICQLIKAPISQRYFPAEHYSDLFNKESNYFWFQSRNDLIYWAFLRYFKDVSKFLEMGCGTGLTLASLASRLPEITYYGADVYTAGLKYAHQRLPKAVLYQIDIHDMPFKDEFDVIGVFDVIEHVDNDLLALKQIYNSLKPGGGVIVTVPQHPFLWSLSDEEACHKRRYSRQKLVSRVKEAGFHIEYVNSFVSLLFPALITSRVIQKVSLTQYDTSNEFNISPLLNKIFSGVMKLERSSISYGVNYPFGGSLLLIGRKVDH